jgi:hypothetical protein
MGTISAPITKTFWSSDGSVYWRRVSRRQLHPRVERVPYSFHRQEIVMAINDVGNDAGSIPYTSTTAPDHAYDSAYKAFQRNLTKNVTDVQGETGGNASLGVSLAQRGQAVEMIEKRALQLFDFSRSLRKGRFAEAASYLGIKLDIPVSKGKLKLEERNKAKKFRWSKQPLNLTAYGLRKPPRGKRPAPSKSKSFADNYLEFHFGWSPLLADIFSACQVLQDGIPAPTIRGRGVDEQTIRVTGDPVANYQQWEVTARCQLIADCEIDNPNLNLLERLGLANPIAVLWDAVPWSFVVDWFSNVGQFLAALVPLNGVALKRLARTDYSTWEYTKVIPAYGRLKRAKMVRVERYVPVQNSFPAPKPMLYNFRGFSPRRGAAAISLLLQQLANPGHKPPKR